MPFADAMTPDPVEPVLYDIFDLVTPPPAAGPSSSTIVSRDIICYPITNITRPLNLFGEFPKTKALIPPTPPVRDSSISNYYYDNMVLMTSSTLTEKTTPKVIRGCSKTVPISGYSSLKDQKNRTNASKLGANRVNTHCKRLSSRALSEPRRSSPSPVAFGRSISKERTFAEEKKRLERISPHCKKVSNLTTRILKKPEYKSSEDLRKAIQKTVLGKTPNTSQTTERSQVMSFQMNNDSRKWISSSSVKQRRQRDDKKSAIKSDCKSMSRRDRNNSMSSLTRTNSTFSIDSTTKDCQPIECNFYGSRKIVKMGAFVKGTFTTKPGSEQKLATEPSKSSPKIKHGKCYPVTTYLSTRRPVSTSKFTLYDRHRSLSPVRSVKNIAFDRTTIPYQTGFGLETRSKSQPPKMVEIMIPDEPTVIHVKPPPITPMTYHSLPRVSRGHKQKCMSQRAYCTMTRAKSEGPVGETIEEESLANRWSVSTPSLNLLNKHSDVCHYRNSDRFLELNQFYSHLERIGYLQKVTSQSDLRPIRKKEEVIEYDLWKKIRVRDKAQKELEFLVSQVKNTQREKKFHYERDVDSIRWHEENDPALRHKSMSVENLKDYFQEQGVIMEKRLPEPIVQKKDNVSTTINCSDSELGLSSKLMSTLSPDQVLKLKTQLQQIYSSGSKSSPKEGQALNRMGTQRSRSEDFQSSVNRRSPVGQVSGTVIQPVSRINLTEADKIALTRNICCEVKKAFEQRRGHQSLDSTGISEQTASSAMEVDCPQPEDVKSKIIFFEHKPLDEPGTTIYHARDTASSSDEESAPVPTQMDSMKSESSLVSKRSHSFSDLKELFGERHESIKCRSVSPSIRYGNRSVAATVISEPTEIDCRPVAIIEDQATQTSHIKIDRDVSWLAHNFESRGRSRKRRTVSGSSQQCPTLDGQVLMPHIDIISKTAALQIKRPTSESSRPVARTGEVEKMRNFFENKHRSSLLGDMFTSEPDISKLRDVSVYLAGSWVAHQYPKREDNFLSLRKVKQTSKKSPTKFEKLGSLPISPSSSTSRNLRILKQCLFPYKIFDDVDDKQIDVSPAMPMKKLNSVNLNPVVTDNGRLCTSSIATDCGNGEEKVLRKPKARKDNDGTEG